MGKLKGKEQSFNIDERVMIDDATDAVRGDLLRALIEFITNSDDSYKRMESRNAPINGNIDIEYDRKLDTAILRVRDFAEGMSDEDIETKVRSYAKQTSGFSEKQGVRSVRGIWGRGLRQGLLGLGSGEIHTVKDGQYNKCEIYIKNKKPRIFVYNQVSANRKVRAEIGIKKKNGTIVFADCSKIKIIPQYEGLRERLQTHFEIRHIISDKTRKLNFVSKRGKNTKDSRVLEFNYPKSIEVLNEEMPVEEFPNVKAIIKLNKCNEELTTISENKESALSGIVFYTQGLAVDNTAFDYSADEAFSYFFGSCDCNYIRELTLKDEPIFSTNRTGPNWNHEFMKALKNTVLKKIKPFIESKRREIQSNRQSQLDKKQKLKIDETVSKLNELFKKLLGDIDGGPGKSGQKQKPDPNGGFGFLSDYYSILSNKTNRISLYAKKTIASEGDIVKFSSEEKNINILTEKVAFVDTEWDDLVVASARVEGGQVGVDTIFCASFDSFEAQTLLHSVAKQIYKETEKPKKKKGGFINDIKWDNRSGIKQRVMFDADNNVVIFLKSPSVSLYLGERGKGLDTPSGQVMLAELVTEAVCNAVAKKAIETGRHVPLMSGPDAINVYANELRNKYADIIHKMYVDTKYMTIDIKKVIDIKSRAEKEKSRVSEI